MGPVNLEAAAHVVQLALTPVFLLSGTATLLGVFATRMARLADRLHILSAAAESPERAEQLSLLRNRARMLEIAVVLDALAGGLTCVTVLVLFLGELREAAAAKILFFSFGAAIVLTMAALAAFVTEILLTTRGVRQTVDKEVGKPTGRGP
jgi:CHASE3 domain sensor protein